MALNHANDNNDSPASQLGALTQVAGDGGRRNRRRVVICSPSKASVGIRVRVEGVDEKGPADMERN